MFGFGFIALGSKARAFTLVIKVKREQEKTSEKPRLSGDQVLRGVLSVIRIQVASGNLRSVCLVWTDETGSKSFPVRARGIRVIRPRCDFTRTAVLIRLKSCPKRISISGSAGR